MLTLSRHVASLVCSGNVLALYLQARLLSAELLQGENKYHCAFCESKVDATRQIRLHCIPPVLCLSLQRFVFDMKVRRASYMHKSRALSSYAFRMH